MLLASAPLGAREPDVRRVRTIETAQLGIDRPAGLAFSRRAGELVVLSRDAGSTELHLVDTRGLRGRALRLGTTVPDPLNATFDDKARRLVFYDAQHGELVEVAAGRDGVPDAGALTRHAARGYGIERPRGMASDPVTGRLFVLDAAGPRLVVIEPEAEGGLARAHVSARKLEGLPTAPLRGLALDPASGNLHAYQPDTARLYELSHTGLLVGNRDLAPARLGATGALVFAPTGDSTDDAARTNLYVVEVPSGSARKVRRTDEVGSPSAARAGRIAEVTITPWGGTKVAASVTATLVQVIDTSQFNPPSPDAMGIAFIDAWGTLLMSDSEIEEIPALFTGENLYEVDQGTGTLLSTASTISYSGEPVGVAYDPVTPRIFISDDKIRELFIIERGPDNTFLTSDDDVTGLSTLTFGSDDPEGVTFHRGRRSVFIADGGNAEVYEWNPGPNEQFGDGDDVMSNFDTSSAGARDPEGITYDTTSGNLYVCGTSSTELFEFTPDGTFVRTIDISAANPPQPSGLAYGPHSQTPGLASVYISDRGIDNSEDPDENDGQIFEVTFGGVSNNQPPVVSAGPDLSITLPETAFLDGDVMDDPTQTLTIQWSEVSGPGTVTFTAPSAEDTTAIFSAPGTYVVRLTADDGELSASDDATVTVNPDPGGPGGSNVIDIEVTATSDDAEEDSTGGVTLNSPDLELVEDGPENQVVGIRFASVPVPPGATVTRSYLQFQADETGSDPTTLTIHGEAADDPPTFTSATANVSSRPTTAAASPTWNPAPWTTGEAGADQQSTDLSAVIGEIVARPGWASGNAMVFIVTGTGVRTAESENGDGGPTLHVEYSTGPPNEPPVVTITSPANGAMFDEGDSVAFAGTAIDPEDGDIGASLSWTSSIDGAIGMGASFSRSDLSPGTHLITAMATDSGGVSGSDQITIEIVPDNAPPVVTITSPPEGSMFVGGASIAFAGTAVDPEDGDISAGLSWTSSIDGAIGTGASFSSSSLSSGTHLITASVVDSGGASGSDQITIEVVGGNGPPVVTITTPAGGAMFNEGASIGFAGSAIDPEDGDISASLMWTSDIDGTIGMGASFSNAGLSAGTHLITATAMDSGGASGSDEVTIEVLPTNEPPVVTITSPASGAAFVEANPVFFAGSAIDPEDGDISAGLAWTSSIDGAIGTGASFSHSGLSLGTHLITAAATDSGGAGGSAQVTFQVISANPPSGVLDIEVVAGNDDAEEDEAGDISLGSSDLELVHEGQDDQVVGIRFVDVAIPQGASIATSYLQFQVDETGADPTSLTIHGQAADDAPGFSSTAFDVSSRPTTTAASPVWSPAPWNTPGEAGPDQRSTDLSAVLEEIVARPGWASGNALALIVTGTGVRTAESENGDGGPTLHVEYSTGPPNLPPVAAIASPASGAVITQGTSIAFGGTASDPEDGDVSASLNWTSSLDGAIGSGASFSRSDLSPGIHVITATATDSGGVSGSDQVTIQVNSPPVVAVTSPAEGATFNVGDSIDFAGSAIDPEDGDISASLDWTSSLDGAFGTGAGFSGSALSAGTHLITATAVDSGGAAGSDQITIQVNGPPLVTITSPTNGALFTEGTSIDFAGSAIDVEDGDISAGLAWTSSLDGAIGTGASFSSSTLSPGIHLITAAAVDSGGLAGSDEITIEVNSPPVVTITAPANGAVFTEGTSIGFTGSAVDPEDGDISAGLAWTSSLDGAIGTGASFSSSTLSAGTHLITATAVDSGGASGSDQITIEVNAPPVVTITAPANGAVFTEATSIGFTGSAIDPEDGDISASLSWTSSIDGAIGAGASFSTSILSAGTHLVTASVVDSEGAGGSDQITIEVNRPPVVTITAPANGAVFTLGASIAFAGSAIDPEDGDISAGLAWSSSIDGTIGAGASFSTSALSAGTHLITATAVDSEGAGGSDQITIQVNRPPVVTITAPAGGALFNEGASVAFAGSAIDPEDGDISAGLAWTSSIDGAIGAGASFSTAALSPGSHLITATAVDSGGAGGSDQITIQVNGRPVVSITTPPDGGMFTVGTSIAFAGSAIDPEEGNISAGLAWTSSIDGTIGMGASFSSSGLSLGSHLITATAVDGGGASGSDQITVHVVPPNGSPAVTITSPPSGAMFAGVAIPFAGIAIDPEDGDISAGLSWTSSIDGSIGAGAAFSSSTLSVGSHLITATAVDSGGASGSDEVTIEVFSATTAAIDVEVTADDDDAEEDEAGGISLGSTDLELVHEGQDDQIVGIRFVDVPVPQGVLVTRAYLQFQVDEIDVDPTSLTIHGQAADDAPGFTSAAFDVSSRPRTTAASPVWNPAPWNTPGEAGPDQQSTDLSAVLNEIVSRPGWAGGNALVLIVTGTGVRTAESEDGDGGPTLHVEYSTGFTNLPPVVDITSPPGGAMLARSSSIVFAGSAVDPEDGDIGASIQWSSNRGGTIGTGKSFSLSGLARGTHRITATVVDSGGARGSDRITIHVLPAPRTAGLAIEKN